MDSERPPRLPTAYWALWSGTLVNRLGNFVYPFLGLYLTQQRGLSLAHAGLLVAAFGAASIASGPLRPEGSGTSAAR